MQLEINKTNLNTANNCNIPNDIQIRQCHFAYFAFALFHYRQPSNRFSVAFIELVFVFFLVFFLFFNLMFSTPYALAVRIYGDFKTRSTTKALKQIYLCCYCNDTVKLTEYFDVSLRLPFFAAHT